MLFSPLTLTLLTSLDGASGPFQDRDLALKMEGGFWPTAPLRSSDLGTNKARGEIAMRFRNTKTSHEAKTLAESYVGKKLSTRGDAYRAALALYYAGLILGRTYARPRCQQVWPLFLKLADSSSPEYARVACDLSEVSHFGRVRSATVSKVVDRYFDRSDGIWLGYAGIRAASRERNVPELLRLADLSKHRRLKLEASEVVDGYGKGARPRIMFRNLEAQGRFDAAWLANDARIGHDALAALDEVIAEPATPEKTRTLARSLRTTLAKATWMR